MPFHRLQRLFPVAVTLHNLEEAVAYPAFAAQHATDLPWPVTPAAFHFALAVLTLAAWIVTFGSWRRGRKSVPAYLLFGYTVAMLVNVVVPHIPAAVRFSACTPGLVTSVFINLPVMTLLLHLSIRDGYVDQRRAMTYAVAVPLSIASATAGFFYL